MNTLPSEYSGNRFELLVQSVTDYAIFMLDTDGRIASWNAGARRFKGYEPDEIIGQHFSRFYTPQDQAAGIPAAALATAAPHFGDQDCDEYRAGVYDGRTRAAHKLADALAAENPRFDREKFLKACGVE